MIAKLMSCALALAVAHAIPAFAKGEPDLAAVRAASERFKDVKVALAEGYIPAPGSMCETSSMMGRAGPDMAMGIHYFRPDMLGISGPPNPRVDGTGTHTDFLQARDPDLRAAGRRFAAAGRGREPGVQEGLARGRAQGSRRASWACPMTTMADDPATAADEAHNFEPHYDRHVWVHRENPIGVFAQFNPQVSCEHGQGQSHGVRRRHAHAAHSKR